MDRRVELRRGLEQLGIGGSKIQEEMILRYLDELLRWNPTHGLVGGREMPPDLVARHILDSLAPLVYLKAGKHRSLADIGSGAGLPGIPLSLFLPNTQVTLVERQGRRCRFLENVVVALDLKGRVRVEQRAVEDMDGSFDLVTLRAFKALPTVYDDLRALTAIGGRVAAYKGRREKIDEELRRLKELPDPPSKVEILPLNIPFLKAERNLVLLTPRRSGDFFSGGLPDSSA